MKRFQKVLRRERIIKLISVLAVLALGATILLAVENMLLSFVLAFVISYLLGPFANRLERAGFSRSVAVLVPFCVTGLLILLGTIIMVPMVSAQFGHLKAEVPKYIEGITKLMSETEEYVNVLFQSFYRVDFSSTVEAKLSGWAGTIFGDLPQIIGRMFTVSLLAPLFAYFMLKDGQKFMRSLLNLVPNNLFELALNLQHQINIQLGGFIRARLLEAAIVGAVVWVGLAIISFPYAALLGVFAAVTNLIPYVGPFIGAVPTYLVAFINGDSGLQLMLITIIYAVSQLIDIVFIIPLVVAKIVNLHPVTVILAIIIGSEVMGVLGMIISIPITSILKLTVNTVYNHLVNQ